MSMSSDFGKTSDSEQSKVSDMPKSEIAKSTETKENVNSDPAHTMPDSDLSEKSRALPEPLRVGKDMPRLPPINMAELTSILQGPNMPSKKLMQEVTEKIKMRNDESGSDDGSVTSGGGVGIQGIFDCILEVSLFHQDSEDESDGEGDEIFVRELPCKFCKKVFGSTMNLKTHVLMTHSQEDPSVLNVKNQGRDGNRKEKLSPGARSRSTEQREKEILSSRNRKRSAGQRESIAKDDILSKSKEVRSRHNSKEQNCKEKESEKKEDKPCEPSIEPHAADVDCSKDKVISSQEVRQTSPEGDDAKKCDLKSSTPQSSEEVHTQPEEASPSKSSKRKSTRVSSSSPAKKVKRSQNQSDEVKDSHNVPLRRSSRRK